MEVYKLCTIQCSNLFDTFPSQLLSMQQGMAAAPSPCQCICSTKAPLISLAGLELAWILVLVHSGLAAIQWM